MGEPLRRNVRHLSYGELEREHMIKLLSLMLLTVMASVPALAQSDAEREVLKLTQEYTEAIARRDASVHERLFADDYTYTPGNGKFMGREEHMQFTKAGALVVESLRSEDVRARVFGDTAVVTGLWITTGRRDAKESKERRIRYILVYVRKAGRWQIVAEQRTGVGGQSQ